MKVQPYSLFTEYDIHLFRAGKHFRLYEKMGAHLMNHSGQSGTYFAVWAPNAASVAVVGNFNGWNPESHPLNGRWDSSGIWEGFVPGVAQGEIYKYYLRTPQGEILEKADPYARLYEQPPRTASVVWASANETRHRNPQQDANALEKPQSIYEMHPGSWKKSGPGTEDFLNYRELADELVPYLQKMNFTHVEFMPVMEHPFYGSWGYQIHGYFAPSSRYGTPDDFQYLVKTLHEAGIGVYLDWVPSHFPGDAHGLYRFDGSALYEHEDPRKGFHPDWKSYIFNYGRNEVKSFLISNAAFWLDTYGVDGLRVDAVASMLYLDYSREGDEWIPNEHGGRENLEAITFMKELNEELYRSFPHCQSIAEESTSWPMVSRPTFAGGLGFGMKWMMGWMNDTLEYFQKDPVYRRHHHNEITFSLTYAFTENFVLPLSHDEVVHGKGSLISRMPGDEWQRFANLRALYAWQYFHPGQKLIFMGCEFGQTSEWKHDESLPWHLLEHPPHKGIAALIADLNKLYRTEKALHADNYSASGMEWIEYKDAENSVVSFLRHGAGQQVLIAINFTPHPHEGYAVGVSKAGSWQEIFNSDHPNYWGSGYSSNGKVKSIKKTQHGRPHQLSLKIPPLGAIVLKPA